jgi:serine/threonine-protein kinase HipA
VARRTLNVYLRDHIVGQLIQDEHGQILFIYSHYWLHHPETTHLSHSLPLREEPFSRNECRGFFAGVLPEEEKREIIAKNLGISARNDFAMLEQLGGECAGAVTLIRPGVDLPSSAAGSYQELSSSELLEILRALPKRPLLAGDTGIRLSLAGAQDKIAVRVNGDRISIPKNGAASTHIIKPAITRFPGLVENEAFCMKLAAAVGLSVAEVSVGEIEDIKFLLVRRFDRTINENGVIARIHQEDICQALGYPPEHKYQSEGGPGLKECFKLIRATSNNPAADLKALLEALIFNLIIGNNDAHAKNFSIIHHQNNTTRLAPLYDLICTAAYPELTSKMAMKIGKAAIFDQIYPREIDRLADECGLNRTLTRERLTNLAHAIELATKTLRSNLNYGADIADLIVSRCEAVIERFQ